MPRIAELGWDVVISCMTGLQGQPGMWNGFRCLPAGHVQYSNDVIGNHARSFFGRDPGLVLILYDAWGFDPAAVQGLATAVWSPVHSQPMSGGDKIFYAQSYAQPIAMSRYGESEMRKLGLSPCYVPHGIDTSVFRPLDAGERDSARDALKVPRDAFMVAMVGANKGDKPPRKGWGEAFAAFARFRKKHPDAVLYCHTVAASVSGIDLRPIAASLGIEKHIIMSSDYAQIAGLYLPPFVAGVMGCADVLLHPSYGEGFGLPIVEAQATGTPVIVGDNSAQTELCGAGWKADCQPYWVADDMAWWHAPQIKNLVQGLEWAYKHRADKQLRDAGPGVRDGLRRGCGGRHVLETSFGDARAVLRRCRPSGPHPGTMARFRCPPSRRTGSPGFSGGITPVTAWWSAMRISWPPCSTGFCRRAGSSRMWARMWAGGLCACPAKRAG